MNYLPKAVVWVLFLKSGVENVQSKEIKGQASSGNFIIHEKYYDGFSWDTGLASINSNVPVTIQRYSDDYYLEGSQPVQYNEAKVLVTSDCAATTYVPQVTFGSDSIDVYVQGAPADMPYLDSSSYEAEWTYESYWCRYHTPVPGAAPVPTRPRLNGRSPSLLKSASIPYSVKKFVQRIMRKNEEKGDEEIEDVVLSNACNVNVEVMFDGCSHDMKVTAPTVRVIDSTLENQNEQESSEDKCIYDFEADIMFSGQPALEGTQSLYVPSVMCYRAVPGRPFVDSTGSTLQASLQTAPSILGSEGRGWSGDITEVAGPSHQASFDNSTFNQNQLLLGEEWTKNALGEHASVASFSAFSIALMTNQAPSDLVQDALNAALDEVRHARTSFDIASRLTGKEIGPGPLPESSHTFGHDLKALALAVAQQGCIDETLSALEAAAEVNLINMELVNDDEAEVTKYSGIGKDVLTWIRDELSTIAKEESKHAALAWRTFKWVCDVEPDACNAVKQHVLSQEELERAFQRRFQSFSGKSERYDAMKETWKKIYSGHDDNFDSSQACYVDGAVDSEHHLVSVVTENIIRAGVRV